MFESRPFRYVALAIAAWLLVPAAAASDAKQDSWIVDCTAQNDCVAHLDMAGVQILVGKPSPAARVRMALRVAASAKSGAPVAMRLGDGWQAGMLVGACLKTYCEVAVADKATNVALAALAKNRDGLIAYQAGERLLLVPFSLNGFTEALKQVQN